MSPQPAALRHTLLWVQLVRTTWPGHSAGNPNTDCSSTGLAALLGCPGEEPGGFSFLQLIDLVSTLAGRSQQFWVMNSRNLLSFQVIIQSHS